MKRLIIGIVLIMLFSMCSPYGEHFPYYQTYRSANGYKIVVTHKNQYPKEHKRPVPYHKYK